MPVKYYKTDDSKVLEAWTKYQGETKAVWEAAWGFARKFGGKPILSAQIHGRRFHGLFFDEPKDVQLWTKPDKKHLNEQRPRKKVLSHNREESKRLLADWKNNYPSPDKSNSDPVWESIGTNWGELVFSDGGLQFFEIGGTAYVKTGAKLSSVVVEITGTEFEEAEKQLEKDKEQ